MLISSKKEPQLKKIKAQYLFREKKKIVILFKYQALKRMYAASKLPEHGDEEVQHEHVGDEDVLPEHGDEGVQHEHVGDEDVLP